MIFNIKVEKVENLNKIKDRFWIKFGISKKTLMPYKYYSSNE